MAIKKVVTDINLGSYFDVGSIEVNKINPVLPAINLTPVGFTPTSTGNTTNKNEFILDPLGDKWFIDYAGDALKIESSASGIPLRDVYSFNTIFNNI